GPAQLMCRGIPPGHIEHLVPQDFRHLGTDGVHPARHDEELLLLEEFLKPGGHALALSHAALLLLEVWRFGTPSLTLSALARPQPEGDRSSCPWHSKTLWQPTVHCLLSARALHTCKVIQIGSIYVPAQTVKMSLSSLPSHNEPC